MEAAVVEVVAEVVVVAEVNCKDSFGFGWRPEIANCILQNKDSIDLVEVIVDNFFSSNQKQLSSLKFLESQIPVTYHGVSLGLATSNPLNLKRLEFFKRIFNFLRPQSWSEHLSFVRADGIEIGHLMAPPRNEYTIESTVNNIFHVESVIGSKPLLENISTLITPPFSTMSETEWTRKILEFSDSYLLLDLHNHYANCINFNLDPFIELCKYPLNRVKMVHLSGGHFISEPSIDILKNNSKERLLDDHIHDIPETVYSLLEYLGENTSQSLNIVIERDGNFPDFNELLTQLNKAKKHLKNGRERFLSRKKSPQAQL